MGGLVAEEHFVCVGEVGGVEDDVQGATYTVVCTVIAAATGNGGVVVGGTSVHPLRDW